MKCFVDNCMQTKDEESAYRLLCQMMFVYSYRDVYSRDLSVLQVQCVTQLTFCIGYYIFSSQGFS